jgi:dual oxidase
LLSEVLGDPRTNQNPALLAFGIVLFRWHNVLAYRVQEEHPDWSDEDVFQRARRLVIASLQVIIIIIGLSILLFITL